MLIGIDAVNIKTGGGLVHLVELLKGLDPTIYGIRNVVIWGAKSTLDCIDCRSWLKKKVIHKSGKLHYLFWVVYKYPQEVLKERCDLLFVPGGICFVKSCATVLMSQNMQPFDVDTRQLYGFSTMRLRYLALRYMQIYSFRRANGVIFLTKYSHKFIMNQVGVIQGKQVIIPHGVGCDFFIPPRKSRELASCSLVRPFRILYVSIINVYKNQCALINAVSLLRGKNIPVILHLIGPAFKPELIRMRKILKEVDPEGDFIFYLEELSQVNLQPYYEAADLFLYPSSCENMPIILLEAMASGLPIIASNRGPMPELLNNAGVYINPENIQDTADTIEKMIVDHENRDRLSQQSFMAAQQYSWSKSIDDTFKFIAKIANSMTDVSG